MSRVPHNRSPSSPSSAIQQLSNNYADQVVPRELFQFLRILMCANEQNSVIFASYTF